MRCLRCTMWMDPDHPEPIVFFRETDVKDWDETVQAMKRPTGDRMNTMDVFEMVGTPDITQVVMFGLRRFRKDQETERQMAILFYWCSMHLPLLHSHGAIATPSAAPFDADRVEAVLWQLGQIPRYKSTMRIIVPSKDGILLTLTGSKVEREPDPIAGKRPPL